MAMAQYGEAPTGGGGPAAAATPATSAAPALGYGAPSEATIDQANIAMRGMPWYQTLLRSWGQDPGHPHNLSDSQKTAIVRGAQANGFVIDESNMEVDDNGNFRTQGHKLRNTLIVVGIAAATIATMGAAGVFAGAGGAAGTAGAAGGVEAGATAGLDASVASGALAGGAGAGLGAGAAGAGAGGAAAAGAGAAGAGGAGAAGSGAFDAAGNFIGTSTYSGIGGGAGTTAAAGATGGGVTDALLRYGAPTAGNIVSSIIGANASQNATDAQQKYLQEALDYEKSRDAAAIALEGNRYSDYSGNIAPYLATGNSANARMTSLLGLPAAPSGPSAPPISYQPSATSTGAGAKIGAPTAPVTTGTPLPRTGALVTMRAPDGSTQQVKPEDVSHFQSLGATVVETAA